MSTIERTALTSDLFTRAQGRVSEISRRAVEQMVSEVEFYGQLPADIVEGELASYMMTNVRLYLRLLREDRQPNAEDLAGPVSAGIRRAQEGVPLSAMMAAYLSATRAALAEVEDMAGPDEQADLVLAGHHALRYLEHLLPLVAEVYLEEHRAMYGEEQELRRAVTAALITGQPVEELAARARVALADTYVLLALSVPPLDAQPAADAGSRSTVLTSDIADRRRARAIQEILASHLGDRVLTTIGPRSALVLVPSGDVDGEARAVATAVRADVALVLGDEVYVGLLGEVARPEVSAAARETAEVAELARLLGREPGVVELDDVLTEYQLTRPGPARSRLAAKVRPLADHPSLRESLVAFLTHDNNSKVAAAELHVHANTLHYRLRRIGEITGLDPANPGELRILAAALVADQVETDG